MRKIIAVVAGTLALAPAAGASDQRSVAGAWIVTLQAGHAVQLGLELKQDDRKVSGTLMIMGHTMELEGEYVAGALTLSGEGNAATHLEGTVTMTATLKDDGTLAGELLNAQRRMPWTAERFTERKP